MANITVTTWIDDAELWSRIFGGGWESFGSHWQEAAWHDGTDWDKPGRVTLWCENEDGGTTKATIDMAGLVAALEKCPPHIVSEVLDDNVDAVSSDFVLQVAVLGECIFG